MKLHIKFSLSIFLSSLIIISIFLIVFTINAKSTLIKDADKEFLKIEERLTLSLQGPLYSFNSKVVEDTIKIELKNEYTSAISIRDENNALLFGFMDGIEDSIAIEDSNKDNSEKLESMYKSLIFELEDSNFYLGKVEIFFTDEPIEESIKNYIKQILIQSILLVFIMIIISYLSMKIFILKPISHLKKSLIDIAEGEGDLTKHIDIKSSDEIGDLSKETNKFIDKLKDMIIKVKKNSNEINSVQDTLLKETTETAQSLSEIRGNIESIQKEVKNLDNQIKKSSDNLFQLFNILEKEGEDIDNQSSAVEESSASINQMIASLNNIDKITVTKQQSTESLVSTSKNGDNKLNDTISVINEINSSVDSISGMLSIINNISENTNLLAMNAAIEAAHAGDAGKGFSVVADEIRKLAESSSYNSKEISSVLGGVIKNIKDVSSMGESTKDAFKQIIDGIHEVYQALSEIQSSTSELSVGGDEITNAMVLLSEKTQNVYEKSHQIKGEAEQVNNSFSLVKKISSHLALTMKEITNKIENINVSMGNIHEVSIILDNNIKEQNRGLDHFKTDNKN